MKDIYHLTIQDRYWILISEQSSYVIAIFEELERRKALAHAIEYVKSAGGRLYLHNEDGNIVEEMNF
jgi:hypothetical protein